MSIKQVNDFNINQPVGGPRTQRARKPSVNHGVTEVAIAQDFKISTDKALKYRSQVTSLNRDASKDLNSKQKRIESGERSLNGRTYQIKPTLMRSNGSKIGSGVFSKPKHSTQLFQKVENPENVPQIHRQASR